ncbi:DUF6868 family protein [Thalassoglobus polymorphus]|uniref:DUF6868 domain-containing protein n=1 Tax=Thalassoglobus polymorphus TaxID=2527994 RepID=A0A517QHY5_9PLAN|nr:hypothetical protein [Thalassoglobus polymorphus]QDT31242.1 hypothetical protein Mal48_04750 [Thalassoglobus polymorphus]
MSIDQLTQFFGWCTAINMGVLVVSTIALVFLTGPVSKIHSRVMGVQESELPPLYFQYLGHYKIAVLVFNLVPYIALKLVT